ncbi:MAG: cytochrome c family protein [SAR324 cluster bacterium]|nr:cytochrome c family protein [SAR324 cluster bacterium]
MKTKFAKYFLIVCIAVFGAGMTYEIHAQDYKYMGIKNCKKCHQQTEVGKQYFVWKKLKHASAYKILKSPEAKEAAKKVGLKGDPQKSEECLICHTTAYGVDKKMLDRKFRIKEGVQCEACHGPGSEYNEEEDKAKLLELKKALFKTAKGTPQHENFSTQLKAERVRMEKKHGLLQINKDICLRCHVSELKLNGKVYKNPSYPKEGFDYEERLEKIEHPRTEY